MLRVGVTRRVASVHFLNQMGNPEFRLSHSGTRLCVLHYCDDIATHGERRSTQGPLFCLRHAIPGQVPVKIPVAKEVKPSKYRSPMVARRTR